MIDAEKVKDIWTRIREVNLNDGEEPIPPSDLIYRKHCGDMVNSPEELEMILEFLDKSHHVFTVKIVDTDERSGIKAIVGYVAAEIPVISKLKERYFQELESAYAGHFYNRKSGSTIVRELVGEAKNFNNTPLGTALNISLMLLQYEHFMAKSYAEFTDTWKNTRLNELVENENRTLTRKAEAEKKGSGESGAEAGQEGGGQPQADAAPSGPDATLSDQGREIPSGRAVDSQEYAKLQEMNLSGKWGEAVTKFGVEFLVRIHLRKYEFEQVRNLVRQNRIARESDLRYIRDTLRKMEARYGLDPELKAHEEKIVELRRLAQMRLNRLFQAKKGIGTEESAPGPEMIDIMENQANEEPSESSREEDAETQGAPADDIGFEFESLDDAPSEAPENDPG